MRSHRRHEGYLLIDHRAGEGLTPELARQSANATGIPVASGAVLESATITCSHCQRVVVLNPDRSRERGYCPKCDHYVCDICETARVASGGDCVTFKQIIDATKETALRAGGS